MRVNSYVRSIKRLTARNLHNLSDKIHCRCPPAHTTPSAPTPAPPTAGGAAPPPTRLRHAPAALSALAPAGGKMAAGGGGGGGGGGGPEAPGSSPSCAPQGEP
ncbi:RNA-binding protein Nova-2-like [Corvus moneduloides]|uniref:RNA-binding protein Nova-2-like n=1 Tax=Corvus moneduloides TaxID=1196302 RepID=UPI001363D230|nr:RNA-binding protein Nova-2-like [Corvus moneduloides]